MCTSGDFKELVFVDLRRNHVCKVSVDLMLYETLNKSAFKRR